MGEGERHLASVPVNTTAIVLVVVEEVYFLRRLNDGRVQIKHLQKGTRATFANANDDGLRQLLDVVM